MMQPILMVTGNMDFIKGFRFDINFPMSQNFTTSHSWSIPNSGTVESSPHPMMPAQPLAPVYTFTTQLVRDIKGREPTTIMVGKVDTEGKVDSIFIKKLNEYFTLRLTGQFMSKNVEQGMVMMDVDYEGKDCNGQFKWGPGHWGVNYMQKVHKNWMIGFDYTNVYQQKMAAFSYGAMGFLGKHSIMAQYMAMHQQFNLGYNIPIKRGSTFISHYKYDATSQKSSATVGLKQRYRDSEIVATVNSNWKMSTNFTLKGPSYGIRLCAQADYAKQDYTFGYGVTIGMME